MSHFAPSKPFVPHRQAAYSNQRASCGCSWDAIGGGKTVGDRCEIRLTGPRCENTEGCRRPTGHTGRCEDAKGYAISAEVQP
jgi:hypothetical protein